MFDMQLETNIKVSVEFFALKKVVGDFKVQGASSMDCSWFDENLFQKAVQGSYQCVGNHTKPAQPRQPSTPSNNADASPENHAGVSKIGIGVGVGLGAIVLIAAVIVLNFFMKRRKSQSPPIEEPEETDMKMNELHGEAVVPRELPAERSPEELSQANYHRAELP